MPRIAAILGDRAALPALGARPAVESGAAALGFVESEPGFAEGPFTAGGLHAVGEVVLHNRAELLAVLAAAGDPVPPDRPDGEVLLRLYARIGAAGVRAADGMFVLAITDGAELVLLRDHAGTRTMFHARAGDRWAASTSLRALRRWPALTTGLNLAAVRSFLTFAYLPGDETLLRGVHEMLPGRIRRLRADGTVHEECFWEPTEALDDATPADVHAATLRALLERATSHRLPAAEPVAVLLSGGVDSSLVTALAAKLHDQDVHTYSIGFGHELPNELAYSGLVATHCHTRHRVLNVSGEAVASRLADAVALLDSPVGDPLTVPNLMLAEAVAADGIRVVLNGEGGDPVFGGPKNLPMLLYELHRDDPAPDARALAYLRSYRKCYQDLPALLAADALQALAAEPGPERFVVPYLSPGTMRSHLNRLLHCNLRTKGAHHILTKVERLTAACGLQGRAPLFDRQVIDHAFTIPPRLKLAGTEEKWILKEAVRDLLPATIVDRPKSGMRVPVQQWLSGPLRELADDVLLGSRASGLFDPVTIRAWLRGEGALLPRQGGKVWLVLTLELWLRAYDVV
ncbi:asparagine synthase-related protein [Dactylosporangium sp. AC04546]|uniref:asparagine synthetase B family protein n=1 Tax=Dactylosporangium sp. AC04546 TaxID=2862460 RepID=UPI001EDF69B2|nr:asparagine synthase-related protein [Dactylosporangium sp. AC04546]WVK80796.1 asparagine synthase-related protein [Dactylosporangium sp. AC04546]